MPKALPNALPHSWDLTSWPGAVWPGERERARLVVRAHRAEMHAFGALTRIGRTLVFLGVGYQKWLASNASRVTEFDVPMNRPEHAHKRFNQARQ